MSYNHVTVKTSPTDVVTMELVSRSRSWERGHTAKSKSFSYIHRHFLLYVPFDFQSFEVRGEYAYVQRGEVWSCYKLEYSTYNCTGGLIHCKKYAKNGHKATLVGEFVKVDGEYYANMEDYWRERCEGAERRLERKRHHLLHNVSKIAQNKLPKERKALKALISKLPGCDKGKREFCKYWESVDFQYTYENFKNCPNLGFIRINFVTIVLAMMEAK